MKQPFCAPAEALRRVLDAAAALPRPAVENVGLDEACGRIAAAPLCARMDQPPFDRSPLDGYAPPRADTAGAGEMTPKALPVVMKLYAGDAPTAELPVGCAARIMTGAPLPAGADCVLMQEQTDGGEETVRIYAELSHNANVVFRGEDIAAGALVAEAGTVLTPAHLGVLAGQGYAEVPVYKPLTIGVLATGSELLAPGELWAPGKIYDANGITLASTSVVWTIWADPSYSSILYTSKTNDDDTVTKTLDPAMCAEVSRELTLRLLSGDGESLDSVDTSSAEYQQQYQTVYDALSRLDSAYVTLATKVNNAVKLSIEKYVTSFNKTHKKATDTSRKGRISVSSEKSFQRNYPYGAFAAAVLGFTDADGVGTYGLEKSYQSTLAGVDGRTITQRNAVGNAIADANATTFAAKDGSNLVLSLDVNVQEIAERYLNEAIAANTVENRGCAIVMNVKTGAILAMASKPDFDPNDPLNYTANEAYLNELVHAEPELYGVYKKDADGNYITDEQGNKILDEEADYSGYYRDILWKNKTITELYYPGSVFKVITSAMGNATGEAP